MVFVAGPRQVGKTTLARNLPGGEDGYLNWDAPEHRERILKRELPPSDLWVFDELHKYRRWRNYLKGLFDTRSPRRRILVTGSARLEFYRFGGDSLQGRYHLLRLHPFSAAELGLRTEAELRELLTLGGYPEPYLGGRRRKRGDGPASIERSLFVKKSRAWSECRTWVIWSCLCSDCLSLSARPSLSTPSARIYR